MGINNFGENGTKKNKLLSNLNVHPDIFLEVEENIGNVSKIVEFRGDICPNCESSNYADEKCEDCGYGFGFLGRFEIYDNDKSEEKNNNQELVEKENLNQVIEKKFINGEKINLTTFSGKKFNYFYYPDKVKDGKGVFEIEFEGKKYLITASFDKKINTHFQDSENVCIYFDVRLEKPTGFKNKNYYFLDPDTKKPAYLDFKLAENIVKSILEKFYSGQD